MTYKIEPIANYHCKIGENPLWDDKRGVLFWTDIASGRLFRFAPHTGEHRQFYSGEPVGGFTIQADGSLLLFQVNKVSRLDPDEGRLEVLVDGIDDEMQRFNDVIADPRGRVYAGTIGRTKENGGLYRVELDGAVSCLFKGTGCSNGMGFSPDRKRFYWTCSTTRRIFQFDYDESSGELSNRLLLIDASQEDSTPDGMTVDAKGFIWSARWGGFAVFKYAPDGELLEKLHLPVGKVSSAVFGAPGLDELYITTAGGSEDSDTADGTLYRVKLDVKGLPEFRSRVLLA